MARTQLNSKNIGQVQRNDFDTTTNGEAVITKVIAGSLTNISSTGINEGTGDVTINSDLEGKVTVTSDTLSIDAPNFELEATDYMLLTTPAGYIEDDTGALSIQHNAEIYLASGKVSLPNTDILNIGTSTTELSAITNTASTTKGILIPRMTAAQRTSIVTPATGLLVYQTDGAEGLYQKLSTGWIQVGDNAGLYSPISHTHTFASLTSKPTTIAGYGITDFNSLGDARWSAIAHTHTFASLTSKPTTLSGFGITDAYPLSGNPSGFLTSVPTLQQVTNAGSVTTNGITVSAIVLTSNFIKADETLNILTYAGAGQKINTKGLLTSDSYADATNVPTNGIYSKGAIRINTLSNATGDIITTAADGTLQKRTAAQIATDIGAITSNPSLNTVTAVGNSSTLPITANGVTIGFDPSGTGTYLGIKSDQHVPFFKSDNSAAPILARSIGLGGSFSTAISATPDFGIYAQGAIRTGTLENAVGDIVTAAANGTLQKRTVAQIVTEMGAITSIPNINSVLGAGNTSTLSISVGNLYLTHASNAIYATNELQILTSASSAQKILTGGVLVSDSYGDAYAVPTNGIYSKGAIRSSSLTNATGDIVTTSANGTLQKRTAAQIASDIGAVTTETDPTVGSHIKAITTTEATNLTNVTSSAVGLVVKTAANTYVGRTLVNGTNISITNPAGTAGNITVGITGSIAVSNGGTGRNTATTAYGIIAAGTTATGAQQTIGNGSSGMFLKSNGTSALASFASIAQSDVTGLVAALAAKGDGTVTNVSGVNSNGLSFSISNPTTTPAITLSTSVSGMIKGVSGSLVAATAAVDYIEPNAIGLEQEWILPILDETTTITTGTEKYTFRVPMDIEIIKVRAHLTKASTSGNVTVDVNNNGSSILSTKITIEESNKSSFPATTQPVISSGNCYDDAEITIDIDAAGTGAKGLKVIIYYKKILVIP